MTEVHIVLVLTFAATFLFVLGVFGLLSGNRTLIGERLARYTTRKRPVERGRGDRGDFGRRLLRGGGRVFAPLRISERVEEKLARADIPLRGEEFLFLDVLLALGVPLLLLFLGANLRLAVAGGLFFCLFPWIYTKQRRQKRLHLLNGQLADSLRVMTNALRAGYSFLQSMEMVAGETPPPLAEEYGRALREMQLGTSTEAALSNLSRRVGSDDLDLVITALLIQRQVGGNLAEVLDGIAETIRERVRIKGEIRTLTAQGRISGLIIGLLPLALLVLLLVINPVYIATLFTDPLGIVLVGGAACGEVLGIVIVRRIVDIRV